MTSKHRPGIRCVECGCYLDPGERCDCEKLTAQRKTARQQVMTRKIIARNLKIMEQAQMEFDYR